MFKLDKLQMLRDFKDKSHEPWADGERTLWDPN